MCEGPVARARLALVLLGLLLLPAIHMACRQLGMQADLLLPLLLLPIPRLNTALYVIAIRCATLCIGIPCIIHLRNGCRQAGIAKCRSGPVAHYTTAVAAWAPAVEGHTTSTSCQQLLTTMAVSCLCARLWSAQPQQHF